MGYIFMVLVKGNLLNVSTEEIYGAEIDIQNGIITCVKPVNREFKGLILPRIYRFPYPY